MYDLRNYKDIIRAAVKRESELDPNWNWKVIAINKKQIKIGWGYLDYLNEKDPFTVELIEERIVDFDDLHLAGFYPGINWKDFNLYDGDDFVFCWIGDKHWHDAKTIEDGLKMVIHSLATKAHNTF